MPMNKRSQQQISAFPLCVTILKNVANIGW